MTFVNNQQELRMIEVGKQLNESGKNKLTRDWTNRVKKNVSSEGDEVKYC